MRTKTLILTAAALAAGIASSSAQQVFSVNAVGYVNLTAKHGFQMIANPLNAADNKISALLPNVSDGSTVYKFNGTTYAVNSFQFGAWDDANMTLVPGEGAFFLNPDAADQNLTFVGEVKQGNLSHAVPKGFSIQSSEVPQTGKLGADLKFPAVDGDVVYQFDATKQTYNISSFDFGAWSPADPTVNVGESFFVNKFAAGSWDRQFSVQ